MRILFTLLFTLPFSLFAGHPPVKEVAINFYNPPANGFQVMLALEEEAIAEGIRAHMAPHAKAPMSFSNHLVYETILYSPMTAAQEVTLHFQWIKKKNDQTALTLVALLGEDESVSTEKTPALARVLLYDYSALVRSLTGEPLDFEEILQTANQAELLAYQDTVRILKEGVYSYEQLLKEQQQFIDTLMVAVGEENARTVRKRTQQMPKTGRQSIIEDSLQLMRKQTFAQREMMQRQKVLIDSLQNMLQQTPFASAEAQSQEEQQGSSLPPPVSKQLYLNSRLTGADSIAETYRSDVTLLSEQVLAQAQQLQLMRRELKAREAAQREVTQRLERMARVARATGIDPNLQSTRKKLNAFAHQNQKLRQQIFAMEEQLEDQQQTLREKIDALKQRIIATETQHHETLTTMNKKLEDQVFENKTLQMRLESKDERINLLSNRLDNQSSDLTQAQARTRAAEDNMRDNSFGMQAKIKQMEAQLQEASRTAETSERRLEYVTEELKATRKVAQKKAKVLEETEFALENEKTVNQGLVVARNRYKVELAEVELTVDSLINLYQQERTRNQHLIETQDSLEAELALINPYTEGARARRRVYQQQLANINELQRRLPKLEQTLYAWEKRLEQKEAFLVELEKKGTYSQMAEQMAALRAENERLKARLAGEEEAAIIENEFYTGDAMRASQVVSAFCLDTDASELGLRAQISSYFRDRKIATLEEETLSFVPFVEKSIADLPIKMSFDISEQVSTGKRRLACTVQFSDGSYFSPANGDETKRRAVQRLLKEILE